MRKSALLLTAFLLLSNMGVSAADTENPEVINEESIELFADDAENVTVSKFQLNNGKITLAGSVEGVSRVTVKVIKSGTQGRFLRDAYAIAEARQINGAFECTFRMPVERGGNVTEGLFYLYINGVNVTPDGFEIVSESERNSFLESLNSASDKEEVKNIIFSEENKSLLKNFGFDALELEDMNTDEKMTEFAEIFFKNKGDIELGENNIFDILEFTQLICTLNNREITEADVEKIGLSFEGINFADITDTDVRKKVVDGIEEEKPYKSKSEIEKVYEKINVLILLNVAKYSEYDDLMEEYEDIINAEDESWWSGYDKLSSGAKNTVKKNVKRALDGNDVESVQEFLDIFGEEVQAYKKSSSSGGGSSSGDSSRPSNSIVSVGGNTTANTGGITVIEKEEKEEIIEVSFTDLADAEWAKNYVLELAGKKIINGYEDGSFRPNANIKREEFVTLVVKAFDFEIINEKCSFSDVDAEKWYYPYVAVCYEKGIVSGLSDTEFGIGKNITREDAAVIVNRILKLSDKAPGEFKDNEDISGYAKDAVMALKNKGIISGDTNNCFNPKNNLTRAECSIIIKKATDVK